jgi:hypothetical protein
LRGRFAEIVAITDQFCKARLNEDYRDLCREMAVIVCREGLPVSSGKAAGWATGIVYSVTWVNFVGDPANPHHVKTEDMAAGLGVSPATLHSKAKVIRDGLGLRRLDPRWTVGEMLEQNPYVWLVEDESGLILDLRHAPRAVQEDAHRKGLIPFIPEGPPAEEGAEGSGG